MLLELQDAANKAEPQPASVEPDEAMLSPVEPRPQRTPQAVDNLTRMRDEIDGYYRQLRGLNGVNPADVFQTCSAISARMAELRNQMFRRTDRAAQAFRTKEIEPLLDEVERQFKYHSRLQATREMEARLTGGFA